jgi:hypothetical protein
MTALAHSLRRIWSAWNRVPHQTRWGASGSTSLSTDHPSSFIQPRQMLRYLAQLARQIAPTVIILTLRIFQ